jgi:hypothetical protein
VACSYQLNAFPDRRLVSLKVPTRALSSPFSKAERDDSGGRRQCSTVGCFLYLPIFTPDDAPWMLANASVTSNGAKSAGCIASLLCCSFFTTQPGSINRTHDTTSALSLFHLIVLNNPVKSFSRDLVTAAGDTVP